MQDNHWKKNTKNIIAMFNFFLNSILGSEKDSASSNMVTI